MLQHSLNLFLNAMRFISIHAYHKTSCIFHASTFNKSLSLSLLSLTEIFSSLH